MTKFTSTLAAVALFATFGAANAADGLVQFSQRATTPVAAATATPAEGQGLVQFSQRAKLDAPTLNNFDTAQGTSLVDYSQRAVMPTLQ
ncbi:hypothetical protein IGB42_02005 [Andreprevotia sp. IGB-42]|uniref:hypothetical protein n=1 Tax=Andreprevotia sp. IGB-42 TaxID=2497473 RepID=UPI001357341F|nr:hypothetical protein [Andreprevotia sp. IGB-42]KAF0813653.1 hypothetical protein IGB42_02005 [Andreprevotia sp. IGB-42]